MKTYFKNIEELKNYLYNNEKELDIKMKVLIEVLLIHTDAISRDIKINFIEYDGVKNTFWIKISKDINECGIKYEHSCSLHLSIHKEKYYKLEYYMFDNDQNVKNDTLVYINKGVADGIINEYNYNMSIYSILKMFM